MNEGPIIAQEEINQKGDEVIFVFNNKREKQLGYE